MLHVTVLLSMPTLPPIICALSPDQGACWTFARNSSLNAHKYSFPVDTMLVSLLLVALKRPIITPYSIHQGIHANLCMNVKKPIEIMEEDLIESFVRGSGPGGQKINKSKNNVCLVHKPTGISVQCQDARDLTTNRKIARKLLKDKIDLDLNGSESKLGKKFERIRKQKRTAAK